MTSFKHWVNSFLEKKNKTLRTGVWDPLKLIHAVVKNMCLLHRHDLKAGDVTWDHSPKLYVTTNL